jgi:hypothetical protein
MILINKGTNNTFVLTLTEKATLSSPVYLFRFINDMQRTEKLFIAADLSSYTSRYNKFLIPETSGSETLTSGVINLSPAGFWRYEVYEQSSTSNLDFSLSLNPDKPLEVGKVKVVGTPASFVKHSVSERTFKTHNPNE